MNQENQTFQYVYSAKEQEEIRRIRSRYMPKVENRMEQLRRLDAQATQRAAMLAIVVGVIGALVLGMGMSCCMVWGGALFAPGIVLGVVGLAAAAAAYPLYERTIKKEREKIAPEMIRLTDELLK